jgi:hypothetical protein
MSKERSPHELWVEANGDTQKYRELMIQAGHLREVGKYNLPEKHVFVGKTVGCPCRVCGGTYRASWHIPSVERIKSLENAEEK